MHRRGRLSVAAALGFLGGAALLAGVANAHQDPPGCEGVNIGQSLIVTPPAGPIRECTPITAETVLSWLGNCLIGSGNLVIGLADPSDPFNPAADQILASVPVACLGPATQNADGCAVGQDSSVGAGPVQFSPRPEDVTAGQIQIRARWVGVGHQSVANQPQSNTREVVLPIEPCAGTFCSTVECVPGENPGQAECIFTDVSEEVCPDDQFCADVVCNDDIDQCVTTDTSATQCPDNDFCADVVCSEELDQCVTTDASATQCPDNQFCADVVCNEDLDQCVTTDTSATQCPDNDFCADVVCSEDLDQCVTTDTSATQCPDNQFCADVVCSEDLDQCVTIDASATQCPDNQFCADVVCNEDLDHCVTTDTSVTQCPDNQFCADVVCSEDLDQCVTTDTSATQCPDGDFCGETICNETTDQCEMTDNSTLVCPDNLFCADVVCNEETNSCDTVPTGPQQCPDNLFCADVACNEDIDQCVTTDTSSQQCTGGNECAAEVCNEAADRCDLVPDPEECDDGNLCTQEICDPEVGCVQTGIVECDPDDRCKPEACNPDTGLCEPTDAATPFLAKVRGQFGNFSEIDGGLGVNDAGGQLRLGRGVFVSDGSGAFGDLVRIGNDSSVYAVYANDLVTGKGVIVRGPTGVPELPLTDPFCPVSEFACGTSRVTVNAGETSNLLAPGVYGSVRVFNGGTLRLAPGTFHFCEIRTGRRTNILTSGETTINVVGRIRLSNGSILGPVSGSPTPELNVLGSQVRIGAGSFMQAWLSAPGALLTMGRGAHLVGTFCVYRTRTDKRVILECPPEDASSPSGSFVDRG